MPDDNTIITIVEDTKNEQYPSKRHCGLLASRLPVLKAMFNADLDSGSTAHLVSEYIDDQEYCLYIQN
jgi:hypothetical protein